jgi:hypothetical protein
VDWPTAAVAMTASGASAVVAIWAVRLQANNSEADRQHDLEVLRKERRAAAYVEMLTSLNQLQMGVERTVPFFVQGGAPAPPPPITDDKSWHLNALRDVIASGDLRTLLEAWTQKQTEFYNAALYLREIQEHEANRRRSEVTAEFGVDGRQQWKKVDELRDELRQGLGAIGEQVRAEL